MTVSKGDSKAKTLGNDGPEKRRQRVSKQRKSAARDFGAYLSPDDAEEYIGVSATLIYKLCAEDAFPHARVGKRIVIPKDLVDEWLHEEARKRWKR